MMTRCGCHTVWAKPEDMAGNDRNSPCPDWGSPAAAGHLTHPPAVKWLCLVFRYYSYQQTAGSYQIQDFFLI